MNHLQILETLWELPFISYSTVMGPRMGDMRMHLSDWVVSSSPGAIGTLFEPCVIFSPDVDSWE